MNFCKWTHPKTGAVRIYINGVAINASVFVVDGASTGHFSKGYPEIVVRAKDGALIGQSRVDSIMDTVDEFVKQAVPSEVNPTFADYLYLAK